MSGSHDQPAPGSASTECAGTEENTLPDTTAHPLAGRYQFMGLLGKGGMGSVYRVRDLHLNEEVALKVLRPDLLRSADIVERFRREVRLARRVTHHNVARTFDIGEHEGLRYLTMELIEGEPISKLLRREGPLPLSSVVAIATQVCAGLAAAHAAGIVHGDLKPDNLLITTEGRVAITDFGIARALSDQGPSMMSEERIAGTPTYMAPEQVEGAPDLDGRADLYSIGCVLYELLTGVPPWQGHSPYLVATARILNPPPDPAKRRPDLPVAVTALVLRCMARDPADRFQSADELGVALLALAAPEPGTAPPVQSPLPATPGAVVSVAILSFRNAGPAEDEYLAEGITENLIDILSTATCLRVRGAGSHPGHSRDPQDLGRELNVEAVLLGSIRKAADSLHIHARLVSVADGFQFWAKHFEFPMSTCSSCGTRWRARLWFFGGEHAEELARSAAAQAALSAQSRGEPRLAQAVMDFLSGDPAAAARELSQEGIVQAPVLAEAHNLLGQIMVETGPIEDGIEQLAEAVSLDPGLHQAQAEMARAHALHGAWEQADHFLAEVPAPRPSGFLWITRARLALWRKDQLRARQFLAHPDMAGGRYPYARMLLEVASSEKASIDPGAILHGWLDLAHSSERTRAFFYQVQTEVACALGQADTAIDSLAQAVGAGLSDQMWIDHCPVLGPIREHSRFGPLRDSVKERASRAREVLRVNRS